MVNITSFVSPLPRHEMVYNFLIVRFFMFFFSVKILKGQVHGSAILIYKNAVFLPGHAVSSMQAISCYNVVKEPICTLPWQSLVLDQLKYLQIAVN